MKVVLMKLCKVVAALAIMITAMNVNTACIYLIHQPKLPDGAKKLRKF
ncbi:MAG: cyclic lactone autoinducer peptide [Herbinix sp.]|nr:cyclic lactone autoinducer peptide [Herbinix sp.]